MENAHIYARTPGTGAEQMDSYTPLTGLSRSWKRAKVGDSNRFRHPYPVTDEADLPCT